jgi:hypothetical protein
VSVSWSSAGRFIGVRAGGERAMLGLASGP